MLESLQRLAACTPSNDRSAPQDRTIDLLPFATVSDTISELFTSVHDVVEVDDSLVIVNDKSERNVWKATVANGSRAPFGGTGDGPA